MKTKICCTCKQEKNIFEFYKHKGHPDGLMSDCRICRLNSCHQSYKRNKIKRLKYGKEYRAKHKIELRKKRDIYEKESLTRKFGMHKASAKEKNFTPLPLNTWEKLAFEKCYYCGENNETKGIDRVDNTKGYTENNFVACCKFCNRAKGAYPKEYFLNKIKLIYLKHFS